MTLHIFKLLHVFLGTMLVGIFLFPNLFLIKSIFSRDTQKIALLWPFSFVLDGLWLAIVLMQFFTGTGLAFQEQYALSTNWIQAAYFLLTLITLLFMLNVYIKIKNYRLFMHHATFVFYHFKIYVIANGMMFAMMILIVRDAIFKSVL